MMGGGVGQVGGLVVILQMGGSRAQAGAWMPYQEASCNVDASRCLQAALSHTSNPVLMNCAPSSVVDLQ